MIDTESVHPVTTGTGIQASSSVVRGGNRVLSVRVPIASYHPDGQVEYDLVASVDVMIGARSPIPVFECDRYRTIQVLEVQDEKS